MRLQLTAALALATAGVFGVARADGTLSMRGVYYKERSTRVMQPMLDAMFEAGTHGVVTGHMLVDAITSASASSGAAASQPFTERRYEGGLGYTHEIAIRRGLFDVLRASGETKFSREPDYRSLFIGARAEAELAQRNTILAIGGGLSLDEVNNMGAQGPLGGPKLLCDNANVNPNATECPLRTISVFTSASQLLSKNALVGISYDVARLDGFTSNAYRQVITGGGPIPEKHPNERLRQAAALSARYFVPHTQLAVIASYRYYWDNWDVHAHTPEIALVQQVGSTIDATVRYRYYRQDAAFFWRKHYPDPALQPLTYVSDDPKMSPFDGHLMEAKLGMIGETFDLKGRWAGVRIEGILEYIVQHNRFGNAVVAHAALTVPFDY